MISDYPAEYGSLPDGEMKDTCDEMCKCNTVSDIRKMSDYLRKKANDMDNQMEKSITMEDFEKMSKKSDMSNGEPMTMEEEKSEGEM